MLKLPNLTWHIQVGTTNIGGAVQQAVNALLAGVCKYAVVWRAMHNPRGTYQNLPGTYAQGATQFTAPYGFGGPGQGMAVAYTRWLERHNQSREKIRITSYNVCYTKLLRRRLQRVRQVDPRPFIAAESVAGLVELKPDLEVRDGVGSHQQLVPVEPR